VSCNRSKSPPESVFWVTLQAEHFALLHCIGLWAAGLPWWARLPKIKFINYRLSITDWGKLASLFPFSIGT
jgi:hypothetical protein